MAAFLAPAPLQNQFFSTGNTPGAGCLLFTYLAGSVSTKQTVYSDSAGTIPYTNPVVLDSNGNIPNGGVIWIPSGVMIKAVYAPAIDSDPPTSPIRTIDNLSGINDISITIPQSEWTAGPTPTFISATAFTVAGDQTSTYTKARRIKATVTAGTVYATVTNSVFSVGTTTVSVAGGALDSGLTVISYGLFDPANPSISMYEVSRQATNTVSSAATTNIWNTDGNSVHITGTTQILNFSTAPYAGASKTVIFDSTTSISTNPATVVVPSISSGVYTPSASSVITVYADTPTKMLLYDAKTQEGNWTPGMTATSGGPLNFAVSTGTFIRNGNLVNVWCGLLCNGGTPLSGAISITGLPFAPSSSGPALQSLGIGYASNISTSANNPFLTAYVPAGSTTIALFQTGFNPMQGGAGLQGSGFGNTATIYVGGSYKIN